MDPHDIYDDVIDLTRQSVFTGGEEIKEEASLRQLQVSGVAILEAFANDNDIQYMQICSTNIGMIRTYQKRYKQKAATSREGGRV